MALTGNVVFATVTLEGNTMPGRKLIVANGRRGWIGPAPGRALLIRCESCQCMQRVPRYPTSTVVSFPRLFSTVKFHCWMYCDGACGSEGAKLTVVWAGPGGGESH